MLLATAIIKLITLILEGIPIEIRYAQSIVVFWGFWPALKLIVPKDVAAYIEKGLENMKIPPAATVGYLNDRAEQLKTAALATPVLKTDS